MVDAGKCRRAAAISPIHAVPARLLRLLWPFWFLRDHMREGRSWVAQLLSAAAPPTALARAELAWTAAVLEVAVADDAAALAARQRLAPLLAGIADPFLHAVSQSALAWTLPITGDLDGALREVTVAPDELRGQEEPVFTAMAAFTAGSLNAALGRYDDALRHMREARDLAGGAAGRRGRRPAAAGRPAGVADAAPERGRAGGPGPPDAGRGAVRSGVLRRVRAHPAGGGSHRPEPAWHR